MEEEKIKEVFANLKIYMKETHAGIKQVVKETMTQLHKSIKSEPFYQTKHRDKSKERFRR